MKKQLTYLSICLIQFIFNFTALAQKFELTPRIPVYVRSNKSASVVKKQSIDVKPCNAISRGINLKSGTTSQIDYSWGKYMSTAYSDRFYKTVIDASDNVIAVGSRGESSSDLDAVIYKYDSSGTLLWSVLPAISPYYDGIYGVVTDKIGNIYITGQFYSSAFGNEIYSNGNSDAFIAKYSPGGTLLWAKNAGGSDADYGSNLALDDAGNVYVVGFFNGTSYWDGISKTSSSQGDMFIAKYDNNGNVKWVRTGDVGANNYLSGIGIDKSGNAYVSFHFSGDAHFEGATVVSSTGGTDMFFIKYDTSGNFKWIKTAGGTGDDGGNDTTVDSDGNILIAGYFSNVAKFENKSLTAHGNVDIFSAKYSPDGNLIWVKQFGGTGSQSAWGVTSDEKSNCYLTGWFSGTGAFDNTTIVSQGGTDAYVIKYDKNGNLLWAEPTAAGLESQVGSGVFVKVNDLAISGYYEGEMNIQNSNFPNSGGEDAYLAKLTQSSVEQPSVYVNPNLSIPIIQVNTGQSITFFGKQFSPVGKVDLSFSGPGIINPIKDYAIDVTGNFQYTLAIASSQKGGVYMITATDKVSGKSTTRSFQIIQNQSIVVDDFLKILEPNMSMIRLVGDPITIAWEDRVKFNVNPLYNYKHSYVVEYKKDNGSWQSVDNIQGTNSGYGNINISTMFTPTVAGIYVFRITDNYYPNRSAATPELTVSGSVDPDIKVEYKWDKSYTAPYDLPSPSGAAADGVARFYMVISNINSLSSGIQKVKITLSDSEDYRSTQFLGKVKYCANQNDNYFTNEADNANSIIAENSSSNVDGKYWFWYVAPDDFARNEGDWGIGDRVVTATFDITLLNGKLITKYKHVFITRPPLMLVHGLNGDPGTWDKFPTGNNETLFINDQRFKIRKAVAMSKNSYFNVNSSTLLAGTENGNSFKWLINEMRNTGYACNKLDYICHSMGGSIFRYAVEQTESYLGKPNYGKGYVNKFISLNTPHDGSSFANFLCDFDKKGISTGEIQRIASIKKIDLFNCGIINCSVVDAVLDLRFKDGIKFLQTNVQSHLIGSSAQCSDFNSTTNWILNVLKLYFFPAESWFKGNCILFKDYFSENGFEKDFFDASDAIVSISSQFSKNNPNFLPTNCSYIPNLMHMSTFGDSPTESMEVGKEVNKLLNSNVNGNLFANIPATKVSGKSAEYIPMQKLAVVEGKVKILYPAINAVYKTGDTMTIKLQVDTLGLKSFALFFQDQSFYEIPARPNLEFKVIVSPEYIEGQSIVAIGNYSISGTASISNASIDLKVNPVGSILDFNVKPEVIVIEKEKSWRPTYEAVFANAIAQIGQTDLITVSIKDPNLVSYDSSTNQFTGLDKGSTNATITYRGKSKTVFFEIIQYEKPPIDPITGINDFELDITNNLDVKTFPNPFSESITFEYSLPATGETRLEIYNLSGIKVKTYDFGLQFKGLYDKNIDLKGLADGIYIYKLTSGKTIQNGRIIKIS